MSESILTPSESKLGATKLAVPSPKEAVAIRVATMDDLDFVDALHKKYNKNLGFATFETLKGKIRLEQMIIAEIGGERVGYLIGQDQYFKRSELGIIYHLVVNENKQRGFIGAALLKAQFERSAYGCRLYCCWCAQDLPANHFWESMGFYPIAFRMGSEKKARVHIFWEKKIRGKDDAINWWFPHKTDQGQIKADRLVFPIPPNTHWKDIKPVVLPVEGAGMEEEKALPAPKQPRAVTKQKPPVIKRAPLSGGILVTSTETWVREIKTAKPVREKKPKKKIDPKFIAVARELRDRYLEEVNERGFELESVGKYDLVRKIDPIPKNNSTPLLQAA